jgi:hypothetical protein
MPSRPPRHAAKILLPGLMLGLLPLLGGCGPGKDQFAPVCPRADLVWQAADLTRYRAEAASGTQDIRDLVLSGRILGIDRAQTKCMPGDTNKQLAADVAILVQLTRGPAMQGRQANVEYFLAVTENGNIVDKQVYQSPVVFPPNIDQVKLSSPVVHMVFPISPTKTGAAYTVLAGFQLTPDELDYNRRHGVTP